MLVKRSLLKTLPRLLSCNVINMHKSKLIQMKHLFLICLMFTTHAYNTDNNLSDERGNILKVN